MWFNMAATLSFGGLMNFGEKSSSNSADNWQDANTALAELDKGTLICRDNYFINVFVPAIVTVFNGLIYSFWSFSWSFARPRVEQNNNIVKQGLVFLLQGCDQVRQENSVKQLSGFQACLRNIRFLFWSTLLCWSLLMSFELGKLYYKSCGHCGLSSLALEVYPVVF